MSHAYGRYHIPEPLHNLIHFHRHDPATVTLKEVDHEPKVGVLDQEHLIKQGILTDVIVSGAQRVDALGSCEANTAVEALSNVLPPATFEGLTQLLSGGNVGAASGYGDTRRAEIAAILFYHLCSDQTGDPAQEWPPTDCGSTGAYAARELLRLDLIKGQKIAHGADNVVSLMQVDGVMAGSPFLKVWEDPTPDGMVDGNGSVATLESQIRRGVAGGHAFYLSAIEKLTVFPTGVVDPWHTIIRCRNHWTAGWGDRGSFRIHLSTLTHILGPYTDFRQLRVG